MSSVSRFIAFDLGAESGRCEVGILESDGLRIEEVHRFPSPSVEYNGHLYWDVLKIVDEVRTGLRAAADHSGREFDGIGIDTWGVDYVLLDPENRLLGYPCHYRDSRTDGLIEKTFRRVSREEIYQTTGCQFMQLNTLFQLMAEQEQSLNFLDFSNRLLMMPNFLHYVLTGRMKAEYSIASTTQLVDPRKREWAWSLIDRLGLPQQIFPEIVEPETVIGSLRDDLADQTGLSPDIPVVAGASHDTAAAVAAVPATRDNWAFLSSGTWSLMGMEIPEPLITDATLERNFTNEGGIHGTTRFLKNIMGLWPVQECRRYWENQGDQVGYDALEAMAGETGPANSWIDVDDPRFFKPGNMPEEIINYLRETGQEYREEKGWLIRCVLESLAFKYRIRMQEIEELTGRDISVLHAVGGGTQNRLLNKLTAGAIGKEVVTGPVEGTAMGNIGVQAVTTGSMQSIREFRELIAGSTPLEHYEPENMEYWNENEVTYRKIVGG